MPPKSTNLNIQKLAHTLRTNPTDPESQLWAHLRAHRLEGVHFRRQHLIGRYIVDFCAPRQKLIIELDGSQHMDREIHDTERTLFLESKGFRVLRFWNSDVTNHIESVLTAIQQALIDGKK